MTLTEICKQHLSLFGSGWHPLMQVVLLEDAEGHLSILYKAKSNQIAHRFQDDFCPIVYPEPKYNVLGLYSAIEALKLMKENS